MFSHFDAVLDIAEKIKEDDGLMEKFNTTPSAENQLSGRELADTLYQQQLQEADTIGEARGHIRNLLREVGTDGEAGQRMQEISRSVDKASEGGTHDNISLKDDLGGGVLGNNLVGTNDSNMRRDQLNPEQITTDTHDTMDTILHENSVELGHAGQDPNAISTISVIDRTGKIHGSTTILEGNVVSKVSARLGQRREGLPQEVYLEGADLVEDIGSQTVDSYVRKGGANIGKHLQTEIWKTQAGITFDEMQAQGVAVGMSSEAIRKAAEAQGKLPKGQEALVGVAA